MSQSAYEKGLIRHDRGQYIDKGNYAYDPRHPDFGGGGADPDGIRDSRRAFADCDTEALAFGAGCTVGPGTYLINSDLTLSAAWRLEKGATIKPANGVTVTFNGALDIGVRQFVDISAGGSVAFGSGAAKEVLPEWFGAVGDGETDDWDALRAAGEAAGVAGVVKLSPVNYLLGSRLDITHDRQVWKMHGATLLIDHDGVGVRVGVDAAVRTRRPMLYGGKVESNGGADWTAGRVGIELLNLSWAKWYDFEVSGFERGVYMHANNGQGTAYVELYPLLIQSCKFPFYLYAEGNGWVNENTVMGGSVGYTSSDPDATGGYAVYIDRDPASSFTLNNNKFHCVSLESAKASLKPAGAIYVNGDHNKFIDLRYEGFAEPFIVLGPDSVNGGNTFAWGRGLLSPAAVDSSAANDNYILHGNKGSHIGGGSSAAPLLTLVDSNSVNNVALRIKRPDGVTVYEIGSDGKVAQGASGAEIGRTLTGSKTWDPGSLADGQTATTTVTVSSAAIGDFVDVSFSSITAGGWQLTAQVTATSTAMVTLTNHTGGIADLPSGTLRALVRQL